MSRKWVIVLLTVILISSSIMLQRGATASSSTVVISEFRTFGPNGSTDEFIELYNLSMVGVDISGWEVWVSNPTGGSTRLLTINGGTVIRPGCYFLLTNSFSNPVTGPYSGPVPGDQTYSQRTFGVGDGVALLRREGAQGIIVDQVGTSPTTTLLEGTALPIQTSNLWTYERKPAGGEGSYQDTDDNFNDFIITQTPDGAGNPQNSQSNCVIPHIPPSGEGKASPIQVSPGGSTLLTVKAIPGERPSSTNLRVAVNLSPIGGNVDQPFLDDGTQGDATANDNTFSYLANIPVGTMPGAKFLRAVVNDAEGRSSSTFIQLTVEVAQPPPQCGTERWPVKTGTDSEATLVDLEFIVPTTVATMRTWSTPIPPPTDKRFAPHERTVYAISGILTEYRLKDDSNYELVIRDEDGNEISCEIPCPCCVEESSPFLSLIGKARKDIDDRLSVSREFQRADIPVIIFGVGFFDSERDRAPNGIELHPILKIQFVDNLTTPIILDAEIKGKKLIVKGLNFDQGAQLKINGAAQKKTSNNAETPTIEIIGKKSGKKIGRGETVALQVENANGKLSNVFDYTRPED